MFPISLSRLQHLSTLLLLLSVFKASRGQAILEGVERVPVILGVMSRCQDALLCEAVFDDVLKQVGPKMTLEMTYIAQRNESDSDSGATCKHGPLECAGNIHQLCAAKHTKRSHWWPFINCMNYGGKQKIGEEETARNCAKAAGIDWDDSGLKDCIQGDEGIKLFHQSIERTNQLNISKSCTIIISGEVRCIRDETWYSCEEGHEAGDFVRIINKEYDHLNPKKFDPNSYDSQATFEIPVQ